jgi:hypothetical protein
MWFWPVSEMSELASDMPAPQFGEESSWLLGSELVRGSSSSLVSLWLMQDVSAYPLRCLRLHAYLRLKSTAVSDKGERICTDCAFIIYLIAVRSGSRGEDQVVTNSFELNTSWAAASCTATRHLPNISLKAKVFIILTNAFHYSLSLSQIDPAKTTLSPLYNIHCSSSLPSTFRST